MHNNPQQSSTQGHTNNALPQAYRHQPGTRATQIQQQQQRVQQ